MEELPGAVFLQYGALSFGWFLAAFLIWKKFGDESVIRSIIEKNTAALIKFETLLTERLPRGGR